MSSSRVASSLSLFRSRRAAPLVPIFALLLGLALLVAGFGLFWIYEHRRCGADLPPDYLRMRRNLSLAVCSMLALTMILSDSVGLR